MYKRKRAGNTITRKINSTKDTAAKADKNHYISNSYLEGFIPIDTEYFTASSISDSPFLVCYSVSWLELKPASYSAAAVSSEASDAGPPFASVSSAPVSSLEAAAAWAFSPLIFL